MSQFVCLFVQFFDPLPVVQGRHQGYVWIAYNPTRKMKLFWTRLEQKDKFRTWHHSYRKHLFVCHRCLSVHNNCLFVRHTQGYQVEEVKLDCYFFILKVSYTCDRQRNILTGNGRTQGVIYLWQTNKHYKNILTGNGKVNL